MATVLWCYLRNPAFKTKEKDYHVSADLTGQANHLGVTIQADIIKQKLPENNGGYNASIEASARRDKTRLHELTPGDHPIDLCRYQVANCYMGRVRLINSGGESNGESDLAEAVQDGRHQQARRRHGPDLRPQGVPAADEGRRGAAERDSGRLSGQEHHDRLAFGSRAETRIGFPPGRGSGQRYMRTTDGSAFGGRIGLLPKARQAMRDHPNTQKILTARTSFRAAGEAGPTAGGDNPRTPG